jgi:hypothetical protein
MKIATVGARAFGRASPCYRPDPVLAHAGKGGAIRRLSTSSLSAQPSLARDRYPRRHWSEHELKRAVGWYVTASSPTHHIRIRSN